MRPLNVTEYPVPYSSRDALPDMRVRLYVDGTKSAIEYPERWFEDRFANHGKIATAGIILQDLDNEFTLTDQEKSEYLKFLIKLFNREVNMSEAAIEQEIQAKGLNAPRLTPEAIDATIVREQYHVFDGTTLTVCCLTLKNGYTVTGESAAASPENFDREIGRKIARQNAREKIWGLEGYLLKQRLHEGETK